MTLIIDILYTSLSKYLYKKKLTINYDIQSISIKLVTEERIQGSRFANNYSYPYFLCYIFKGNAFFRSYFNAFLRSYFNNYNV